MHTNPEGRTDVATLFVQFSIPNQEPSMQIPIGLLAVAAGISIASAADIEAGKAKAASATSRSTR